MTARITIDQFCKAIPMSRATYFRLQRNGMGPRTVRVGGRVLINRTEINAWQKRRRGRVIGLSTASRS